MQNEFSSTIQIFREGRGLLLLVAIDLTNWRRMGSPEKLTPIYDYIFATRSEGLKCVLLWEDYWIAKRQIVESRLLAMLGTSQKIPARLTTVSRINKEITSDFLDTNHLNGAVSSKTRYGLFLPRRYFRILDTHFRFDPEAESLLVAVATFSYPRIFKIDGNPFKSCELIRFASLLNSNVVGGLDKLLHAFVVEKAPDDIMTYADLDWSDGASYSRLGFELKSYKAPETYVLNLESMVRSVIKEDLLKNSSSADREVSIYNMGSVKYVKTIR